MLYGLIKDDLEDENGFCKEIKADDTNLLLVDYDALVNYEKETYGCLWKLLEYSRNTGGKLPKYYSAWNNIELTDFTFALTTTCGAEDSMGGIVIIDEKS